MKSEIENLERRFERVEKSIQDTNAMKLYASDLQTYLGCKTMETEVAKETNLVQSMINDGNQKQVAIKLKWDKKITNILHDVSTFGSISEDFTLLSVVMKSGKETQVRILASPPLVTIDDIKVSVNHKSNYQIKS